MSKLIPLNTYSYLRKLVNVALPIVGIDCDLYIPDAASFTTQEGIDIYATQADYTFTHYECQVFIDWSPNVYRLRKRGLFVENDLPILCYLPTKATNDSGDEIDIEIFKDSYISIDPEFNTSDRYVGTEEFILADNVTSHFSDAIIFRVFKLVPRRKGN